MKHYTFVPNVSLFPFLSVLICVMGILAFMSITFLLISYNEQPSPTQQTITFQWVGAPAYVKPIFIRCRNNQLIYYDLFQNRDHTLSLNHLLKEIQGKELQLKKYLVKLSKLNQEIKHSFGTMEYYPLLLVYPSGILASELVTPLIEQVGGLNVGLEPMLPHWEVPYQSQSDST